MNREAAALGVPAYTTFAGRLGAVDRMLVEEGSLRVLTSADDLEPRSARRGRADRRAIRRCMLDLMLSALER